MGSAVEISGTPHAPERREGIAVATSMHRCPQCGGDFVTQNSRANRAERNGAPLYCGKVCSGLGRRNPNPPTDTERKAAKAEYDREYRTRNADKRKRNHADWYRRNHDREKERAYRQANVERHNEYCRRPEYVKSKADYDKRKRYAAYGEYADAVMVLDELMKEIRARADKYERAKARGYYTRAAQQRRRELWQTLRRT